MNSQQLTWAKQQEWFRACQELGPGVWAVSVMGWKIVNGMEMPDAKVFTNFKDLSDWADKEASK